MLNFKLRRHLPLHLFLFQVLLLQALLPQFLLLPIITTPGLKVQRRRKLTLKVQRRKLTLKVQRRRKLTLKVQRRKLTLERKMMFDPVSKSHIVDDY